MAKRKIDEQISYNWLFFLLAGAFAAVTAWAVYDEMITRREYKKYQLAFFQVERDLTKEAWEKAKADLDKNERYKELLAQKEAIEAEIRGPKRAQIEELEAELQEARFEAFDKTQNYTFTTSELDEAYYYYTLAKHDALSSPDDPAAKKNLEERKRVYEDLVARSKKDEQIMKEAEARKEALEQKLAELKRTEELTRINKEIEAIVQNVDAAQRAYEKAASKLTGLFGPAFEVLQQDLPEIDKVDRCESCHLGASRGGFETVARKEFRSHPMRRTLLSAHPPEKFGCTTCHDGQGRATIKFFAHAPGPDEDAHAFHKHYWDWPLLKGPPGGDGTEYMESKCQGCHQGEWDLRSDLRCEIDAECPSTEERPMVCDVPPPTSTPGAPFPSVQAAEEFATLQAKIAAGEARAPEEAKYCLEVSPQAFTRWAETEDEEDKAKQRERMVKRADLAVVDLAPNLSRGLRIIEEVGCYGCHPIRGYEEKPRPAPALTRIAHKTNAAWMIEWIKDPKAFRPNTRMPRFWPELLDPELYPSPIDVEALEKKRDHEATAMTAFLLSRSKESKKYAYELEPIPVPGDAERGKKLVATLGCAGCHTVPVEGAKVDHKNRASHYDYGPDLSNVGAKTTKVWLYNWVKDPKRFSPETRMPSLRLTNQEAADIAEFLSRQVGDKTYGPTVAARLDDPELIEEGEKLVRFYGCYGCHTVEGYETTPGIGAELSEFGDKKTDRLDFGDLIVDHNEQTWDNWTFAKLKHPRVYAYERAEMRMPQFDLTEDEIRAVMVVLKGMRGATKETQVLGRKLTAMEKARERGRELVRLYNCFGCHTIDGHEGDLLQLDQYRGPNAKYGPPPLLGQGDKAQPDWLFGFLKRPFLLRPLPKVRMPTFGFDDKTATELVAMFSALDGSEYPFRYYADVKPEDEVEHKVGRALFEFTGCQKCHVVGEITGGDLGADVVAPNLVMAKDRLRAEWLTHWIADPNALQKGTAMPGFWLSGNPLELALQDPNAQAILGGVSREELEPYLQSRERQIEAVRDYLFILTTPTGSP